MKANELRIGNYVTNYEGEICKIQSFHSGDAYSDGNRLLLYSISRSNPIPITEEWLEKLGFEPLLGNEFAKWLDKWEGRLMYIDPSLRFYGIEENGSILFTSGNNFKYIHQLQNLYFALTGQEL